MVGGERGDIDDEVVVAGIVTGSSSEGLGVVFASLVGALHDFTGSLLIDVLLLHEAFHASLWVGDDEQAQGVGVVLEDVEAGAAHNDAGLLFGEFFQDYFLLLVELHRIDFERLVGDGGSASELFVEPAEVGPPVPFCGFDLLDIFFG